MPSSFIIRFNGVIDRCQKIESETKSRQLVHSILPPLQQCECGNRAHSTQFTLNHKTFRIKNIRHWYGQKQNELIKLYRCSPGKLYIMVSFNTIPLGAGFCFFRCRCCRSFFFSVLYHCTKFISLRIIHFRNI